MVEKSIEFFQIVLVSLALLYVHIHIFGWITPCEKAVYN